jgi:hypothetical protein
VIAMSYCRWSSDGFRSDVYAYEDVSGQYVVFVRPHRYRCIPAEPDDAFRSPAWIEWRTRHTHTDDCFERVPLLDGQETFMADTLDDLLDILACLRARGVQVPDSAFARIGEELAETAEMAKDGV